MSNHCHGPLFFLCRTSRTTDCRATPDQRACACSRSRRRDRRRHESLPPSLFLSLSLFFLFLFSFLFSIFFFFFSSSSLPSLFFLPALCRALPLAACPHSAPPLSPPRERCWAARHRARRPCSRPAPALHAPWPRTPPRQAPLAPLCSRPCRDACAHQHPHARAHARAHRAATPAARPRARAHRQRRALPLAPGPAT